MRKFTLLATASIAMAAASPAAFAQTQPGAVSMQEAITVAMQSNPEIIQAQMNKEAIEFERKQAQGLYLPRVDLHHAHCGGGGDAAIDRDCRVCRSGAKTWGAGGGRWWHQV